LDLIIIDEISMVRADLLDAIDRTLRVNLGNDKPFGGMQMLLVGDFLQLPHIANEEESRILLAKGYDPHTLIRVGDALDAGNLFHPFEFLSERYVDEVHRAW
jgi:hypothetical protein